MQSTRQHILEILKDRQQATVEEIVEALSARVGDITAVTVRHHLEVLRGEGLIAAPSVRRRNTPGRPQHVYTLTEKALELFPSNYRSLAAELLLQIKAQLPPPEVNVILEGVADQMTGSINLADLPISTRLDRAVAYLSEQGYTAQWEATDEGYILHTNNCPYHHLADKHQELCEMDFRLVANLLRVVPRRLGRLVAGQESCSYFIPDPQHEVQVTTS